MIPPYALDDDQLLAACSVERARSSGPGGQHMQKTESSVRLVHRETGVEARCQDHRERRRNQADALVRLRLRLALQVRGRADPLWIADIRRGTRLVIGVRNPAYPKMVAVVLDALADQAGSLAGAGTALAISSSQVAKLLTSDKEVHQAANRIRQSHGLGAIHA